MAPNSIGMIKKTRNL